MKNIIFALLAFVALTSCTKYTINGSSDMQDMDGRMLYLKGVVNGELRNIDSCDIVHGQFHFSGSLDSVRVVTLSIDEVPVIPVVLEDGEITIELNSQQQVAKGTPLNDTLTSFNRQYEQLIMELQDLGHQQNQAIMEGYTEEEMNDFNAQLVQRQREIMAREDRLVSKFISDNFDNCLGSYVFQLATSSYQYPMMAPWIDALMANATETFKNDPYVKEYMEVARHNQDVMTGMAEPGQMSGPSNIPAPTPDDAPAAPASTAVPPTPNEMAAPVAEE